MSRFALLGAAGFVAPRHMEAIKATGGELVACFDPFDSVGVIDRYFPEAAFFTEFERFDRHVYKLQCSSTPVDYVSICSPNHLHDAHIRWALRIGASPICEKPLVLNPENLGYLSELERQTGLKTNAILQLRLHDAIVSLRERVANDPRPFHAVDVSTITPRGTWYGYSWKGDIDKSGGLATNIGVHLLDMLIWVFGPVQEVQIYRKEDNRSVGYLQLEKARVRWFLSIDGNDLGLVGQKERKAFRSIVIDGVEFPFAQGFEDLHTRSYQEIVEHRGFTAEDAAPAIVLADQICWAEEEAVADEFIHPLELDLRLRSK